jgi:ring-1,2-phenylacetyl-CoA epoxidase subunit PaaC
MSLSVKQLAAVKELLFKIADDQLIIGHRNSEWTGLGPILEEDIAFSSIAQDKLGQAQAVYNILHTIGEAVPDELGFMRNADEFRCCQYVEYPIGEYDFSLIRNFLFNHAEYIRFNMLAASSFEPISKLALKIRGEIKYHVMHADTWIKQLGLASEESRFRMQKTLDDSFDLAMGIFEPGEYENELIGMKVFPGEEELRSKWLETIEPILNESLLKLPEREIWNPVYGGRKGVHSEYLQPLLDEMSEVFRIDPETEW